MALCYWLTEAHEAFYTWLFNIVLLKSAEGLLHQFRSKILIERTSNPNHLDKPLPQLSKGIHIQVLIIQSRAKSHNHVFDCPTLVFRGGPVREEFVVVAAGKWLKRKKIDTCRNGLPYLQGLLYFGFEFTRQRCRMLGQKLENIASHKIVVCPICDAKHVNDPCRIELYCEIWILDDKILAKVRFSQSM